LLEEGYSWERLRVLRDGDRRNDVEGEFGGAFSDDGFGDAGAEEGLDFFKAEEDFGEADAGRGGAQESADEEPAGVGRGEDFIDDKFLEEGVAAFTGEGERDGTSHLLAECGGFVIGLAVP
jgi:hypothetical protein